MKMYGRLYRGRYDCGCCGHGEQVKSWIKNREEALWRREAEDDARQARMEGPV